MEQHPIEYRVLDFPLRGGWKAFHIPGHHPNAFDFVGVESETNRYIRRRVLANLFVGGSAEDWYGWSKPVFAPCDGVVAAAGDGWPDREKVGFVWDLFQFLVLRRTPSPITDDSRSVGGNYVMLRMADGAIVFMCHMRRGSLTVAVGESVRSGQRIGEVGNSGNSLAPHLHLNLFEGLSDGVTGATLLDYLSKGRVPPFRFHRLERLSDGAWRMMRNVFIRKGDRVRSSD